MPPIPEKTEWLRAGAVGRPVGVERDAKIIRGYVVAQLGIFKDRRGEFDRPALEKIVALGNASSGGLKSRFGHPGLSDDGLGKFLGRAKTFSLDGDGKKVRADLHLSETAHKTPNGDLAGYVMELAESDPEAFSSSLVLHSEKTQRLGDDGRPKRDEKGQDLPPLWMPTKLHASDVVDTGAAVDGFLSEEGLGYEGLSIDGLPDELVRRAAQLFDRQFMGCDRSTVETRALAWLGRYLDARYGAAAAETSDQALQRRKAKLKILAAKGK